MLYEKEGLFNSLDEKENDLLQHIKIHKIDFLPHLKRKSYCKTDQFTNDCQTNDDKFCDLRLVRRCLKSGVHSALQLKFWYSPIYIFRITFRHVQKSLKSGIKTLNVTKEYQVMFCKEYDAAVAKVAEFRGI